MEELCYYVLWLTSNTENLDLLEQAAIYASLIRLWVMPKKQSHYKYNDSSNNTPIIIGANFYTQQGVVQLVERVSWTHEVVGASPITLIY